MDEASPLGWNKARGRLRHVLCPRMYVVQYPFFVPASSLRYSGSSVSSLKPAWRSTRPLACPMSQAEE